MSGRRVILSTFLASAATVLVMMVLWTLGSAAAAPPSGSDAGADALNTSYRGPGGDSAVPGEQGTTAPGAAGPDGQSSVSAVPWSHWNVLGWNLQPRSSSTTYEFAGEGCIYQTGGTDHRFTFPVNLPSGSIIKYLQFTYDDRNASDLTAILSRTNPGLSTLELASVASAGSSGVGIRTSNEITHTVHNELGSYQVTAVPGVPLSVSQICGIRIYYYAPLGAAGFMPMIRR